MEPEKFKTASGKVIRTILQQLEQAQLVKNLQQGIHKGRVLTKKGLTYIEEAAGKKEA